MMGVKTQLLIRVVSNPTQPDIDLGFPPLMCLNQETRIKSDLDPSALTWAPAPL